MVTKWQSLDSNVELGDLSTHVLKLQAVFFFGGGKVWGFLLAHKGPDPSGKSTTKSGTRFGQFEGL